MRFMKALWQKFMAWEYHKYALIGTAAVVVVIIGVIIALCAGAFDPQAGSKNLFTSALTGGNAMSVPSSSASNPATVTTDPSSGVSSAQPVTPTVNPTFVTYNASEDAPFLPKNIFSEELYVPGIVLGQSGLNHLDVTNKTDVGAFVIKGEFGKCYEVKIPAGVPCATAAVFSSNPLTLTTGQQLMDGTILKNMVQNPTEEVSFMYNCRTYDKDAYLVIYTGKNDPVYIGERTIIAPNDTQGPWYVPNSVGSISSAQRRWTSDEFLNNLYEPLRNRYPDYITRSSIGKDATGQYDMYCYVFAPENYETTIFLNGGTHGDEGVGYFALAKVMQLIADAKPEDAQLYTLRHKVRFVVIPLVNVWSVSKNHSRANGNGQDINRDYENLTQQESKNVIACFKQYAEDVSVAMDFHIANASPANAAVYFNFINYSDNAVVNYKTTNHMYHRYKELYFGGTMKDLSRVPGSYVKSSQYFEGRIWNEFGIPTITIEYLTTKNFPSQYSKVCMTLAVETYMNFILQNGLFYLQND